MSASDGFVRLRDITVERSRVFVRADLDCPSTAGGELSDDAKLVAIVPTLRALLEKEAQVVVAGHRGDQTERNPRGDLEPVAARLAELLDTEVYLPDESIGLLSKKLVNELRPGRLVVLDNLLYDVRESEGDASFARELADGVELYVAECLSGPHHYASIFRMPKCVRQRVIGLHFEQELIAVNRLRHLWSNKSVLVAGGRFDQRLPLLNWAGQQRLTVCVGGALARTLFRAGGKQQPIDEADRTELAAARSWLRRARDQGAEVLLPTSVVCDGSATERELSELGPQMRLLDVGAETAERYAARIEQAPSSLVVGSFSEGFASAGAERSGTQTILDGCTRSVGFSTIVDEPDLAVRSLLDEIALQRIGFISSAGAAFVSLLCHQRLAGVEALRQSP